MSPEVKSLLESHKDDLLNNSFYQLYREVNSEDTAELTEVFLKAGINPLEYMSYVPKNFLHACVHSIEGFTIPDNIIAIEQQAFAITDLTSIVIPEGVKRIARKAFSGCSELVEVWLPHSVEELHLGVFNRDVNLKKIYYNGTLADWENISKHDLWLTLYTGSMSMSVTLMYSGGQMEIHT